MTDDEMSAVLEKLAEKAAETAASNGKAALETAEPEEPHVPWDGKLGKLLDDVASTVKRFLWLGKDETAALALWLAHTYVFEAAEVTPYLGVFSPTRRCGKSTLLRLQARPQQRTPRQPHRLGRVPRLW